MTRRPETYIELNGDWNDPGWTDLPNGLLDDQNVSLQAKVVFWYVKRHGGRVGASDVAEFLNLDFSSTWRLVYELTFAGWLTNPDAAAHRDVVFKTNEMPTSEVPR